MTTENYSGDQVAEGLRYLLWSVHQYGEHAESRDESDRSPMSLDEFLEQRARIPEGLANIIERVYSREFMPLCYEVTDRMNLKGINTKHIESLPRPNPELM